MGWHKHEYEEEKKREKMNSIEMDVNLHCIEDLMTFRALVKLFDLIGISNRVLI